MENRRSEAVAKQVHFPTNQAQPQKTKGFFNKLKAFGTFKRMYKTTKDYILWSEYLQKFIFIPENFLYDNASVPKILNSVFKSDGILLLGACPHDFGYKYGGLLLVSDKGRIVFMRYSKKELDTIFKELNTQENGLKKSSSIATFALTVAGGRTWKNYRKENHLIKDDFPGLL